MVIEQKFGLYTTRSRSIGQRGRAAPGKSRGNFLGNGSDPFTSSLGVVTLHCSVELDLSSMKCACWAVLTFSGYVRFWSCHSCSHQGAVCRVHGSDPVNRQLKHEYPGRVRLCQATGTCRRLERRLGTENPCRTLLALRAASMRLNIPICFGSVRNSTAGPVACEFVSCHNSCCHWWLWIT